MSEHRSEKSKYYDVLVRTENEEVHVEAFRTLSISSQHEITETTYLPECNPLPFKSKLYLSHNFYMDTNHNREISWMRKITIVRSSIECRDGILSKQARSHALQNLREFGICVIPRLFSAQSVMEISSLAKADMKQALERLLKLEKIDLLDPNVSLKKAVDNYHEIATRNVLRCDLRKGPRMTQWKKSEDRSSPPAFTSNLPAVVDMITNLFSPIENPKLEKGNWGKWNFGQHGPGSKSKPCIGKMGSVISFPGSRSQAIHADTPHLFATSSHLPPHYVNMFCPGVHDEGETDFSVGQTAFFVKSHRLSESSKMLSDEEYLARALVRPHLKPGDAVFFDTRILHFGLPNTGNIWRPILYINYTQPWFARERTDKNWGRTSLFDDDDDDDEDVDHGKEGAPS